MGEKGRAEPQTTVVVAHRPLSVSPLRLVLAKCGFCFHAILIMCFVGIALHGLQVEMLRKLPFVTTKGFHIKASKVNQQCDPCECLRLYQITETVLHREKRCCVK